MKKSDIIKQYIPLAVLTILAAMVIFLGVVSAANAQNFNQSNVGGEVIAGPDAGKQAPPSEIFQPLMPHKQTERSGRFTPRDDTRPTRIGRAGRLPEDTVRAPQQPQPTPNMDDMPSLSDGAENDRGTRLGPTNMDRARRAGDLRRMAQQQPSPVPDFEELALNNTHIRTAQVQVVLEKGHKDQEKLLNWRMNPVEYPVFIKKMNALQEPMSGSVSVEGSDSAYDGVKVSIIDNKGTTYAPVKIYQNRVTLPDRSVPLKDSNRDLETWTLGTAKRHDQREIIAGLIHVMSYKQCKALGHTIVDALPRQCILPDGTTFIEINEKITQKDRKITNFEKCLKASHPIVDTFPRKCVAPGGRVYVEPPQL